MADKELREVLLSDKHEKLLAEFEEQQRRLEPRSSARSDERPTRKFQKVTEEEKDKESKLEFWN